MQLYRCQNVEIVATDGTIMTTVILDANAMAAGITTVNFSDTNAHDKVTVGSGLQAI